MSIFTILLLGMLAFVLVMGIAMAVTLRTAIGWSKELGELTQYGVETTGRVIEKRQTRSRGNTSTWLRYEYEDQFGKTHRSRRNIVTPAAWEAHSEGGPIAIIYSQRHPGVSGPKYLIDLKPAPGGTGSAETAKRGHST